MRDILFWPSPLRPDLRGHKIVIPSKPCPWFTSWAKPRRKLGGMRPRGSGCMTSKRIAWLFSWLPQRRRGSRRPAGRQPEIRRTTATSVWSWVTKWRTGLEQGSSRSRSCGPCWWSWDFMMEAWSGPVRTISLWGPHGPWLMPPTKPPQKEGEEHLQSVLVGLSSLAPFATNIVQQSFSCPAATWCARIANGASNFANALCVVDPFLQPAMGSSWIENPDLAVGWSPWNGSYKFDGCGAVLLSKGSELMHSCMLSASLSCQRANNENGKLKSVKLFDSALNGNCRILKFGFVL